jgi:hypothetical protein
MSTLRWSVFVVAILLLAGCSPPKPRTGTVQGTVTIDGDTPVAQGDISFYDEGTGKAPLTLPITDGKYQGEVPVGKHKIMINAYKDNQLPAGMPGGGQTIRVNILPLKYNEKSTEYREVSEAGPNTFDFKVTTD